jgi:hypothetical protein
MTVENQRSIAYGLILTVSLCRSEFHLVTCGFTV